MALGSTQPLVKMSTRNIPGGKGGRCVRLTSPPSCAECHGNLGALTSWNPLGHAGPVTGFLFLFVYIYLYYKIVSGQHHVSASIYFPLDKRVEGVGLDATGRDRNPSQPTV
jgi:hypothetical protein